MSKSIQPQFRNTTGLSPYIGRWQSARVVHAAESVFAALLAATLLLAVPPITAQTPAATPAPTNAYTPAHKPLHPRTRPSAAHPLVSQVPAPLAPIPPPEPPPPNWPANDQAAQASVVWDSQRLRIDAQNASLQQILQAFSKASGAQIQGMGTDERVFGTYGPGQARDVLSQLLQGSGYNVIMVGDQGQGAPRRIVLSIRPAPGEQPAAANNPASNDEDIEAEEPQPQLPAGAIHAGLQPRSPVPANVQEQQRLQQIRDQQMQQRGNPQN